MVGMELITINIKSKIMKLEELTTDELMNIEGGGLGNLFYDVCYATFRTFRFASDLSNSLQGNSNYGNPMIYK
jgi:bacteriocin-like protein